MININHNRRFTLSSRRRTNFWKIYSNIRVEDNEMILVLANLSRMALENFTLLLEVGFLGKYTLKVLFGEGDFPPVTFQENGGLDEYALLASIDPWEKLVLKLTY